MNALHLSSEEFRSLAQRVTSLCGDFLQELDRLPTFPRVSGSETQALFAQPLPLEGLKAAALDALPQLMQFARPPSPRFFGYVLGSGEPVAALGDLLASVLNQNVTAWRSSPSAVAVERQVLRWIAEALGCDSFTGSFCGGGSTANLMALAMAREAKVPANEAGAQPGVVYASTEIHMSTPKAVALLGLGRRDSLKLVAVDEQFRIDLVHLQTAIEHDVAAGRKPIAIVASAGTVNTGAIDPLPQIAALCKQYDLWLHVDGAYGGLAALAAPDRFAGLAQADSISLDPHKWLYQPVDCALLLYKDRGIARATFSHTGEYAKSLDSDPIEGFMFFDESLELSRRFRALKLWLSLRYHGLQAFRAAIEADLDHAGQLRCAHSGVGGSGTACSGATQCRVFSLPRRLRALGPE